METKLHSNNLTKQKWRFATPKTNKIVKEKKKSTSISRLSWKDLRATNAIICCSSESAPNRFVKEKVLAFSSGETHRHPFLTPMIDLWLWEKEETDIRNRKKEKTIEIENREYICQREPERDMKPLVRFLPPSMIDLWEKAERRLSKQKGETLESVIVRVEENERESCETDRRREIQCFFMRVQLFCHNDWSLRECWNRKKICQCENAKP